MSVECVAIFWVVNASSGEKSCLQFSIPTGSGAGGEGGVSHSLKCIKSSTENLKWNKIFFADRSGTWTNFKKKIQVSLQSAVTYHCQCRRRFL